MVLYLGTPIIAILTYLQLTNQMKGTNVQKEMKTAQNQINLVPNQINFVQNEMNFIKMTLIFV